MRGGGRRLLRYADAKGAALRAAGAEIVQRERVIAMIHGTLRACFLGSRRLTSLKSLTRPAVPRLTYYS